MQRGNPNIWTVHCKGTCHQVKEVKVYVPLETVFKKDGPQPRATLKGKAYIRVKKGTAYLYDEESFDRMSDDEYFDCTS